MELACTSPVASAFITSEDILLMLFVRGAEKNKLPASSSEIHSTGPQFCAIVNLRCVVDMWCFPADFSMKMVYRKIFSAPLSATYKYPFFWSKAGPLGEC